MHYSNDFRSCFASFCMVLKYKQFIAYSVIYNITLLVKASSNSCKHKHNSSLNFSIRFFGYFLQFHCTKVCNIKLKCSALKSMHVNLYEDEFFAAPKKCTKLLFLLNYAMLFFSSTDLKFMLDALLFLFAGKADALPSTRHI